MHRTLFFIPHELFGIPIFGFGWLLAGLVCYLVATLAFARRSGDKKEEMSGTLGVVAAAAVMVVFVFPGVEIKSMAGEPIGMAIRGYGAMLLIAVGSAVALAVYRAKKHDISGDTIMAAAPWLFILGIFGARLFYVVEYHRDFNANSIGELLRLVVDFTRGGIVVYGALIGGFVGLILFCRKNKLPFLRMADIIIPCIFVGLFFGRIGCLMNGCCYGGRCPAGATALEFPRGSPVYDDQALSGELIGLKVDWPKSGEPNETPQGTIESVEPDSIASQAGIESGKSILIVRTKPRDEEALMELPEGDSRQLGIRARVDGQDFQWSQVDLPDKALPVAPAQLYSSGLGLIVAVVLVLITPWITTEGVLLGIGFATYAVVRFCLELIRSDEPGQFGTALTISQWVSVFVLIASLGLIVYLKKKQASPSDETPA